METIKCALKSLQKNFDEQRGKLIEAEKMLKAQKCKYEKEIKNIESMYINVLLLYVIYIQKIKALTNNKLDKLGSVTNSRNSTRNIENKKISSYNFNNYDSVRFNEKTLGTKCKKPNTAFSVALNNRRENEDSKLITFSHKIKTIESVNKSTNLDEVLNKNKTKYTALNSNCFSHRPSNSYNHQILNHGNIKQKALATPNVNKKEYNSVSNIYKFH